MQRKQYIKPIAKPKSFSSFLICSTPGGFVPGGNYVPGDGESEDINDEPGGRRGARSRYDIDWFSGGKNSSFDF